MIIEKNLLGFLQLANVAGYSLGQVYEYLEAAADAEDHMCIFEMPAPARFEDFLLYLENRP